MTGIVAFSTHLFLHFSFSRGILKTLKVLAITHDFLSTHDSSYCFVPNTYSVQTTRDSPDSDRNNFQQQLLKQQLGNGSSNGGALLAERSAKASSSSSSRNSISPDQQQAPEEEEGRGGGGRGCYQEHHFSLIVWMRKAVAREVRGRSGFEHAEDKRYQLS
jgi:hypothetical protein